MLLPERTATKGLRTLLAPLPDLPIPTSATKSAMSRHPVNGQRRALDEPFDVMGE